MHITVNCCNHSRKRLQSVFCRPLLSESVIHLSYTLQIPSLSWWIFYALSVIVSPSAPQCPSVACKFVSTPPPWAYGRWMSGTHPPQHANPWTTAIEKDRDGEVGRLGTEGVEVLVAAMKHSMHSARERWLKCNQLKTGDVTTPNCTRDCFNKIN